ncbi:hypothetical protein C9I57_01125 [Trinickia symbiotica]|uniref:Uncharacterized protein n=1 Tax=Trinickia symbiotica TaxID=863227 RepID=A0A2T3Y0X7_9BURK|nr:hypothetical protein [Trinickia symbiotica]PTB22424.1 hypothetical protein C9I57_01125 [Trinickia symbiotica]
MSIATMLRWIAERLAVATPSPHRTHSRTVAFRPSRHTLPPLRWRLPWLAWQWLSWAAVTLLAPPFWIIGVLTLINPHSDEPFFWGATMTIVPVANAVAIVATNQHHYRAPFTRRWAVSRYYFITCMAVSAALFLMLLCCTNAVPNVVSPLAVATYGSRLVTLAAWLACLTSAVGISSSAHASILHAWLAFEP